MTFHKHVLPNGLTIIGETSPSALSVALGFFVRTGSRDEAPQLAGVSHFLEHMVFKGTEKRSALDVNRDFDRIGAHSNACTSEENTIFYAAILPEYLPDAVDILADILRPSLRTEDFDTEKQVIIEEIGMYDDQPVWSAYDQARRLYFADHPLGNSVLGTKDSVGALTSEQMRNYFKSRYVAPNITVAAAGQFDFPAFVALIEKHCGQWPTGEAARVNLRETLGTGGFQVVTKPKVMQEHLFLLSAGPPVDSPLRYAAETLATIVGDDSGSRLYWDLVDPGLADSADMSFHEYEGTSCFFTSFSCEPARAGENLGIVRRLLHEVQTKGITEAELQQAKNKITSRVVRGGERPMNRMQAVGATWIYLHEYRTVDEELAAYEAVTLADIQTVRQRYPLDRITTLALGPLTELKPVEVNGQKG
ncbi:zinc protease [Planctomycetaceae bacterium SCGC AG-212-F19]|nr:zinc protease [Planctomycetaceae bacterium SCGC AG-212-F19]